MEAGPYHVRVLVLWAAQVLLVQHRDGRDGISYWLPPGGGSEPGEGAEAAAVREVKEETGLNVRVLRRIPVPVERGYICFLAELVGPDTVIPELEEPSDGIYTVGAAWHPVNVDAPLAVMEPEYWSELAPVIRDELRRSSDRPYREAARYYRARPPYSEELSPRLSALLGWSGEGRLLDVGCGPGIVALELAPSFGDVVGLDPEETMLEEARAATPAAAREKVRWMRGRAEDLPTLGLGRFDAVTFGQSFHRTDRAAVAEVVYDLLAPGGALVLIHHETTRGLDPSTPAPSARPPHPPVPHALIREMIARYVPQDQAPHAAAHERHEMLLARTRFGPPERLVLPGRASVVRTVDEVIDAYLGTAFAAPDRFGWQLDTFRAEFADLLRRRTDTGAFWWWPGDTEVLIARKAG